MEKQTMHAAINDVKITSGLLGRVSKLVKEQVLPYQWDILNDVAKDAVPDHSIENFSVAEGNDEGYPSHCIANFKIAAGREKGDFYGMVFQDSDLAKWLEAVAYRLMSDPDEELEKIVDDTVDLIGEAQYITTENAQKLILDIRNKYSGLRKELDAYREVRDTKNQVMNPNAFKYSGDEWYKINQDATKKYYQEYTKDQRAYYDELLRLADRMNDETFSSFQGLFDKLNDLNDKAGTWEKDRAGARDEIAGIKTTASKKEIIPAGSIMEMQKKIADLRKKYENAADEGTRVGFMKAIKEAETELKMMQLRAAGTSLLPTGEINKPVGRNIADDVKSGYINIKPISTDSIQANYDYADSLGAIASIMGSVTNMTNEGAAGWLAYGANILSSISAAIPMITSLTTALTAKAAAEAAGSAAAVPVVGWINAVAAITAIMSAMAAVPKFADGGIIGGNSFIGDNMIARVNSGEMILNNRQQRNLFNLLDGKGGTSVNAGGEVKLRIEGRDLVGVINSQTSKTSKYK